MIIILTEVEELIVFSENNVQIMNAFASATAFAIDMSLRTQSFALSREKSKVFNDDSLMNIVDVCLLWSLTDSTSMWESARCSWESHTKFENVDLFINSNFEFWNQNQITHYCCFSLTAHDKILWDYTHKIFELKCQKITHETCFTFLTSFVLKIYTLYRNK